MSDSETATERESDKPNPSTATESMTFRIRTSLREQLDLQAEFTNALSSTEMVRSWVTEHSNELSMDKRYIEFLRSKGMLKGQAKLA